MAKCTYKPPEKLLKKLSNLGRKIANDVSMIINTGSVISTLMKI